MHVLDSDGSAASDGGRSAETTHPEERRVRGISDGTGDSGDAAETTRPPAISVIVPVRNDPENLSHCLAALDAALRPGDEVIVVDDASTDSTPDIAGRHGARLIRQETHSGPAAARNRAARSARHSHLFFIDADVCVQPGTLDQVAERFVAEPTVDAFFGSYDASPGATGIVSQYRNLLHHYVHQTSNETAFTFWSGCGAIKKSVFLNLGGFDTSYTGASIEDIELGSRLRRAGHRIAIAKTIQVKHMKRWTLRQMVQTDIQNRGIPWTRLVLRQQKIPNDMNLRGNQRFSVLMAGALVAALAVWPWFPELTRYWWPLALGLALGIALLNLPFYAFLARVKSPLFALLALPLHILYFLSSGVAFAVGLVLHLRDASRRRASGP